MECNWIASIIYRKLNYQIYTSLNLCDSFYRFHCLFHFTQNERKKKCVRDFSLFLLSFQFLFEFKFILASHRHDEIESIEYVCLDACCKHFAWMQQRDKRIEKHANWKGVKTKAVCELNDMRLKKYAPEQYYHYVAWQTVTFRRKNIDKFLQK